MCERTQVVSDRKLIDHQRIIKSSVSRELLSPGKVHLYQPAYPGAFQLGNSGTHVRGELSDKRRLRSASGVTDVSFNIY